MEIRCLSGVMYCQSSVNFFSLICYHAVKLRCLGGGGSENSVSGQGRRAWIIKSLFPN